MEEKKYLKWYNKVGYGSGDIAGNVVYAFLTSFVMVYLTDTVGLASGIVGTLIAVSKLFDGFTDVFFGSLIDKTHSRLGKARPWMIYGYIGCAITLVACFAVPAGMGKAAQYTWFFIAYTLLNGVFYTANNIAYSALTSLITKNSKERVQMGSYRFIFAFSTSLLIQTITVGFVDWCGGDAAAWRLVAIIYAIVGLVVNTISGLSVKELPEEELNDGEPKKTEEKYSLVQAFKLLIKNKYYIMICGTYILQQLYSAMIGAGLFYMTWVLKNKNLFGQFAWAVNIPLIIALIFTPTLVGKWKGMYKLNLRGYIIAVIGRSLVVVAGYIGNIPLMLAFTALAALGEEIVMDRCEFIDGLSTIAYDLHKSITGGRERLEIVYEPDIDPEAPEGIYGAMLKALDRSRAEDLRRGFTTAGPHRDDIGIALSGIDVRTFGSQGQKRTAALSLKLSELAFIREIKEEAPVLILDDVLSELDEGRQQLLMESMKDCQCFLTCTSLEGLKRAGLGNMKVFRCKGGEMRPE